MAEKSKKKTHRLDRILMHRFFGPIIFLGIVYLVFTLSFLLGDPFVSIIEEGKSWLSHYLYHSLANYPILQSLLAEGIVGGVGGFVAFLPNVILLFGGITILEHCGYMDRVNRMMQGIMRRIGLQGQSFAPMLLGFGCSVPAILSTRSIPNHSDRLATIAILPMMSCAGRLPIYMMFVSALFNKTWQPTVLFSIYATGVLIAITAAKILKSTIFRSKSRHVKSRLVPLRIPEPQAVLKLMTDRAMIFIKKAGTFILGASIILWFLNTYPQSEESKGLPVNERLEQSFAGQIGHFLEPVSQIAGFDWKINSALLGAFSAKEVFVSQMSILCSVENETAKQGETLSEQLREMYTPIQGLSIMVFCLIALPCMGTVATAKKEAGTWWFALAQFAGLTCLGFLLSTLIFQLGNALYHS